MCRFTLCSSFARPPLFPLLRSSCVSLVPTSPAPPPPFSSSTSLFLLRPSLRVSWALSLLSNFVQDIRRQTRVSGARTPSLLSTVACEDRRSAEPDCDPLARRVRLTYPRSIPTQACRSPSGTVDIFAGAGRVHRGRVFLGLEDLMSLGKVVTAPARAGQLPGQCPSPDSVLSRLAAMTGDWMACILLTR